MNARVTGPLFSMSASGTIGHAVTYGAWKGQPWARVWFKPENPNTVNQQHIRKALQLMVAYWQSGSINEAGKAAYEAGAASLGMSGYNLYARRALNAYIDQLTIDVKPLSVAVAGVYPDDVFTWAPVV
jgi:hypothetical protein